ncbi:hypothetical protein F2Q70_00022672 [Brassica cretica]|uniref:Uncharacterized protein n=1 Tax=Brassica cretica TaxID=69181 RepID=A0A8S9GS69_BRACR|nr:hypothetical protein F2Q70_00022672 [Brassica cretica]
MDWPCSKSNSGTLIRQATGSRRRRLFVFFFFPNLLPPRRIGSFAFLRRSSPPSHFPSLASSSYSLRFISFSCTGAALGRLLTVPSHSGSGLALSPPFSPPLHRSAVFEIRRVRPRGRQSKEMAFHSEEDKSEDYLIKIVLIGDCAVRTSNLLARFARDEMLVVYCWICFLLEIRFWKRKLLY